MGADISRNSKTNWPQKDFFSAAFEIRSFFVLGRFSNLLRVSTQCFVWKVTNLRTTVQFSSDWRCNVWVSNLCPLEPLQHFLPKIWPPAFLSITWSKFGHRNNSSRLPTTPFEYNIVGWRHDLQKCCWFNMSQKKTGLGICSFAHRPIPHLLRSLRSNERLWAICSDRSG